MTNSDHIFNSDESNELRGEESLPCKGISCSSLIVNYNKGNSENIGTLFEVIACSSITLTMLVR